MNTLLIIIITILIIIISSSSSITTLYVLQFYHNVIRYLILTFNEHLSPCRNRALWVGVVVTSCLITVTGCVAVINVA